MNDPQTTISHFKAHCLRLAEQVAQTGEPLVVTKRGRPLVRVVPVEDLAPLQGTVRQLVSDEELMAPTSASWDAAAQTP